MSADETAQVRARGGCLCGAVRFELSGPLRPVVACHCGQCRRSQGHYASYTALSRAGLRMVADDGLAWYRSSETARRGFCARCGSSLFWDTPTSPTISVAAGCLDSPTGLATLRHIFVADKGDYYEVADGLEQLPGGQAAPWPGEEGRL